MKRLKQPFATADCGWANEPFPCLQARSTTGACPGQVARKEGADGFILFNLNEYVVREVLPKLKIGVASK